MPNKEIQQFIEEQLLAGGWSPGHSFKKPWPTIVKDSVRFGLELALKDGPEIDPHTTNSFQEGRNSGIKNKDRAISDLLKELD